MSELNKHLVKFGSAYESMCDEIEDHFDRQFAGIMDNAVDCGFPAEAVINIALRCAITNLLIFSDEAQARLAIKKAETYLESMRRDIKASQPNRR